uniref:Uncharacterized protein n=1 Tax=Zea mays TaxID=4577 RepID=C0PCX8_MAIZE|nr:unknown [Zea mays]
MWASHRNQFKLQSSREEDLTQGGPYYQNSRSKGPRTRCLPKWRNQTPAPGLSRAVRRPGPWTARGLPLGDRRRDRRTRPSRRWWRGQGRGRGRSRWPPEPGRGRA